MNRGRHKKSKEKEFNTQVEILDTIQKELRVLLLVYENQSSYSMRDYYAKARNLSLMLLAGMITNLKHIKHFVRDTEMD